MSNPDIPKYHACKHDAGQVRGVGDDSYFMWREGDPPRLPQKRGVTMREPQDGPAFGRRAMSDLRPGFKPGDVVSFCGEEAVVVADHGDRGTVEMPGEGRMTWYWVFQGEPVRLVRRGDGNGS